MQFKLPDLGEGLQEAEVIEWLVNEGDNVEVDELVVLVETAKAIVEVPSPVSGVISKICVAKGQVAKVNDVLIEYEEHRVPEVLEKKERLDTNTRHQSVSVVGELKTNCEINMDDTFEIDAPIHRTFAKPVGARKLIAPPSILAFATKLGLENELDSTVYGELSFEKLTEIYEKKHNKQSQNETFITESGNQLIKLKGAKKVMAQSMTKSCQQVPAVTLFDDANISLWAKDENITLRLLGALVKACIEVPILNAWFDEENLTIQMFKDINIGVAVNVPDGLYVPVIRHSQTLTSQELKETLAKLIVDVTTKKIQPQKLLGATISLSNFGTLSGRYATPIIVPPQVAILGVGKIREEPIVHEGAINIARIMPVSLSFDHRAASGADASNFLVHFINQLQKQRK